MRYLVGAACVAVITASSVYLHDRYQMHRMAVHRAEMQAQARAAKAAEEFERLAAEARRKREARAEMDAKMLPALKNGGCEQAVIDTVYAVDMNTVGAGDDFRPSLANDMRICVSSGLLSPEQTAKVKATGYLDYFASL